MLFGLISRVLLLAFLSRISTGDCLNFSEARNHIGETRCIQGRVIRVEQDENGVHYLDFCEDYRACIFTVVIFASDLKHVGDVRQLSGKIVEVHGPVRDYDGRAEIILREADQLSGEAARLPALTKTYDVERKGKYSAGTFSRSTKKAATTKKKQPAQLPIEIPADDTE